MKFICALAVHMNTHRAKPKISLSGQESVVTIFVLVISTHQLNYDTQNITDAEIFEMKLLRTVNGFRL